MLYTTNPIIKHKVGLLHLAEEPGNVSKACKIMGFSRGTFYRYQELAQDGGVEALIDRSKRKSNIKNRVDESIAVLDYAINQPAHGQYRTSNELRMQIIFVSGSGVRSIWVRHGVENFKKRRQALEANVAAEGILLTYSQIAAWSRKSWMMKRTVKMKPTTLVPRFAIHVLCGQPQRRGLYLSTNFR